MESCLPVYWTVLEAAQIQMARGRRWKLNVFQASVPEGKGDTGFPIVGEQKRPLSLSHPVFPPANMYHAEMTGFLSNTE